MRTTFPVALAALAAGVGASKCPDFTNCQDCLNPADPALDCGWCSPDPAIFADGTPASQCMDHTSTGWACFHLYMHDGCIAGYVCNQTSFQCQLGPPGQGDTKENCEKSCHAPPPPAPPQYFCNASTFTCEQSPIGHTSKDGCSSACSNSTPPEMVGLWRGLDVQTGFTVGEYVMNFTTTSVTWGPLAEPRKFAAHVATLSSSLVRLTLTAPASLAGSLRYASYSTPGWPTGPETRALTIALQRDGSHQAPPENTADAMGVADFEVYAMNQCNSWKSKCSFADAFLPPPVPRRLFSAPDLFATDPCTQHSACDTCISDPLKVCGWCDGIITFGDGSTCGSDGNGCCGGASGFSKCAVAYRKECPVVCDWTNWTAPTCRAATTHEIQDPKTQTFEDCDTIAPWCKYTFGHYCNRDDPSNPQCMDVSSEDECKKTPGCDPKNPTCGSNCTKPPPVQYYYCDTDAGTGCKGPFDQKTCDADPKCKHEKSCDPSVCKPEVSYKCDPVALQCKQVTGHPIAPYYNTSKECKDACYDHDVSGVWRALRIDNGFVADEWDFVFTSATAGSTVKYTSKKEGKAYTGSYAIGAALTVGSFASFELVVTLSTGEKLTGIFSNKDKGPLTKYMYLGLPLTDGDETHDYDDAMDIKKQEFVLIACLPQIAGCDFSPARPTLA